MHHLFLIPLLAILASCAGPTNPFGGDILISDEFSVGRAGTLSNHGVNIHMSPDRQYYNSPYDLSIKIFDPKASLKSFKYEIVYNNKKLNRWLKSEEIIMPKTKDEPITIHFKNLSLLPGNINKIAFLYYPTGQELPVVHTLEVPECLKKMKVADISITPFRISDSLKANIVSIANKYQYNPSLIAALIAQESSFNPYALSVAKALGLTQVTPVAHREIARVKEDWEIYPGFSDQSFMSLRSKLKQKLITQKNDWRLNQEKSIEGGILYLNYLSRYWANQEKRALLQTVFNQDIPMTDILLASYNSGAYRVRKAIEKNKKNWLFDENLNEARKYVMNIKSYCYSFHQGGNYEE